MKFMSTLGARLEKLFSVSLYFVNFVYNEKSTSFKHSMRLYIAHIFLDLASILFVSLSKYLVNSEVY
mgnify:CR=1 FL=1